jgi:hypothetical protein
MASQFPQSWVSPSTQLTSANALQMSVARRACPDRERVHCASALAALLLFVFVLYLLCMFSEGPAELARSQSPVLAKAWHCMHALNMPVLEHQSMPEEHGAHISAVTFRIRLTRCLCNNVGHVGKRRVAGLPVAVMLSSITASSKQVALANSYDSEQRIAGSVCQALGGVQTQKMSLFSESFKHFALTS